MLFILEITIKDGHEVDEFSEPFVEATKIIQEASGAQGCTLHRKIGDPQTLLAIATWESPEARQAMVGNYDPSVYELLKKQADISEVKQIGEFEEAEWTVNPPAK